MFFVDKGKPEPGVAKGLTLILDSHTDLQSEKSISDDWMGFLIGVSKAGDFPILDHTSFLLSPGHQHYIGITATNVKSNDLKSIDPMVRNCLYPDEYELKLKGNYTSSKCTFECKLIWGWEKLNCTPWYFPQLEDTIRLCDPWDTHIFMNELEQVPKSRCDYCLPDCDYTSYKLSLSAAPFR